MASANGRPGPCTWSRDVDLARRAREGNPEAIDELLGRMGCVRRFHLLKNGQFGRPLGKHELEDLLQETLFALWRKLELYNGSGPLEAWAYRFAYLRFLARVRKLDRSPRLLADVREVVLEPEAPVRGDPFRFERLYRMLERVGTRDERLIRLKVFEQRTFEEVAEELDLPTNTVKTRFYRALARLRGMLEAADGELRTTPEAKA